MAEDQKVALVTGSALNIGRQIALHLARAGYRVMTTAHKSEADARETARLVREAGCDADTHMADIGSPQGEIPGGRICRTRWLAGAASRRKSPQWWGSSVPTRHASSPDGRFM